MVRIRFRRMGLKRQPSYRIVVTDQRKPRNGGFLEVIGHHNPRTRPDTDVINEGRALYWLSVGAQPSDAVKRLMKRTGTWERFERFRKGEDMQELVSEAEKEQANAEPVDPRTGYPSPAPGQGKNAKASAEAAASAEDAEEEAAADTDEPQTEVAEEAAAEEEASEDSGDEETAAEDAEVEDADDAEEEAE